MKNVLQVIRAYGVANANDFNMMEAEQKNKRIDKQIKFFVVLATIFILFDVITTMIAFTIGGFVETNQFVVYLMENIGVYVGLIIFGLISFLLQCFIPGVVGLKVKKFKRFWLYFIIFFLTIRAFAVTNNVLALTLGFGLMP